MVSVACAGERYVEVRNPPEARGSVALHRIEMAHKAPARRHISAHVSHRPHRHVVATARVPKTTVASTATRASRLTFDDIPRQITPEGNVLRVDNHQTRAEVQR
ncbi:hypothetical protein BZM27_43485 [Paraburkholderia steynii]|uniref:Uncharacterized protein n=1 Tax=Paraburkholderia steynii TaxID=1245441 RepID=A0A4R0X1X0_9BURK|nr:hypothetical protein BZM27_43485 [Paraburkholderia steynii]